jgi:tRNA threonylcarbamoyladenosine biosynthesis protein TsaE
MVETEYRSSSFRDTVNFGKKITETLYGGEVIMLTGVLGSGKTTIAKGIAQALGIADVVTSPSFAIMSEYRGRLFVYHFDFYRIDDEDEMEDLLEDYAYRPDSVTVIEWGEKLLNRLDTYIQISITLHDTGTDGSAERHISVTRRGV